MTADPTETRAGRDRSGLRRFASPRRLLILALALLAGVALALPSALSWFGEGNRSRDLDEYAREITGLGRAERDALLQDAVRYNELLRNSPLSDPYVPTAGDASWSDETEGAAYRSQLAHGDGAPLAVIRIPRIDVDLPVFHGTGETALSRGVGHLYGSSLPVGGSGTHAVLTAHNGFTGAEMFDDLDALLLDDEFEVEVLGQRLRYRVDQIEIVSPAELEELRQVPGRDLLTLVTCTPRYINSDRLLVRAVRVPAAASITEPGGSAEHGPPWWIALLLAPASLAIVAIVRFEIR